QSTRNRKTETETAVASVNGRIPLLERRKNPRKCVCRNANPSIAHFDGQPAVFLVAREDRNLTASRRELHRVANQIRQNLFELARIRSDVAMPSLELQVDPNPSSFLLALKIFQCAADHLVSVHPLELQPQQPVGGMGEVEQLGDQMHNTLNIAADECQSGLIKQGRQIFLVGHADLTVTQLE